MRPSLRTVPNETQEHRLATVDQINPIGVVKVAVVGRANQTKDDQEREKKKKKLELDIALVTDKNPFFFRPQRKNLHKQNAMIERYRLAIYSSTPIVLLRTAQL